MFAYLWIIEYISYVQLLELGPLLEQKRQARTLPPSQFDINSKTFHYKKLYSAFGWNRLCACRLTSISALSRALLIR